MFVRGGKGGVIIFDLGDALAQSCKALQKPPPSAEGMFRLDLLTAGGQ